MPADADLVVEQIDPLLLTGRRRSRMVAVPNDGTSPSSDTAAAGMAKNGGEPGQGDKMAQMTMVEERERGLFETIRSYPPAVFFMLGNEFCERFSFYGMRAILFIYLTSEHNLAASTAYMIYHAFIVVAYMTPLIGSVLADSYFGRFKVILYVSIVYVFGHVLLSVGSIPYLSMETRSLFDFGGLLVIAIATGGIKPCVSAFAADQFEEHQYEERSSFFSFFYFAINAGSFLALLLTPILRGRVRCFGSDDCFPLAFGLPGVLMLLALVFLLMGWKTYKKLPPTGENLAFSVAGCIGRGVGGKALALVGKEKKRDHWLDHAEPRCGAEMVHDVKGLVSIAGVFMPLVLFWALFDQQGSTWVDQAKRMDTRLGYVTLLPDQVAMINPILIMILLPLLEGVIYPILRKVVKVTPLRKMAVGGLLAALSFAMAGLVQFRVSGTQEPVPASGAVWLRTPYGQPPTELLSLDGKPSIQLKPDATDGWKFQVAAGQYRLPPGQSLRLVTGNGTSLDALNLQSAGKGYALVSFSKSNSAQLIDYSLDKIGNGGSRLIFVTETTEKIAVHVIDDWGQVVSSLAPLQSGAALNMTPTIISSPDYKIVWGKDGCDAKTNCSNSIKIHLQMGATYLLRLDDSPVQEVTLVRGNTVNILWQLPQYIIITMGEALLSVTGLEFAYSQSAPTMKSVLQAIWLVTVFLGNAVDMVISGAHLVHEPATEFFVYAALMALVMLVFVWIATRYTYVENRAPSTSASLRTAKPSSAVPPPPAIQLQSADGGKVQVDGGGLSPPASA